MCIRYKIWRPYSGMDDARYLHQYIIAVSYQFLERMAT